MTDLIVQFSISILGMIGVLALIVTIITEMTKDIYKICNIPTKLYVIIVSMVVNIMCLIIYGDNVDSSIDASYYLLAFMSSFVVAYISTYGWESFDELRKRFMRKE